MKIGCCTGAGTGDYHPVFPRLEYFWRHLSWPIAMQEIARMGLLVSSYYAHWQLGGHDANFIFVFRDPLAAISLKRRFAKRKRPSLPAGGSRSFTSILILISCLISNLRNSTSQIFHESPADDYICGVSWRADMLCWI